MSSREINRFHVQTIAELYHLRIIFSSHLLPSLAIEVCHLLAPGTGTSFSTGVPWAVASLLILLDEFRPPPNHAWWYFALCSVSSATGRTQQRLIAALIPRSLYSETLPVWVWPASPDRGRLSSITDHLQTMAAGVRCVIALCPNAFANKEFRSVKERQRKS